MRIYQALEESIRGTPAGFTGAHLRNKYLNERNWKLARRLG